MFLVRLPQPAPEVGLQVVGHTTPVLEKLLVSPDASLDVRLVRPEEGLHGLGGKLFGILVVFIAEAMHIVPPEVGHERARRLDFPHGFAINLQLFLEDIDGIGRRRQHPNALLRSQTEAVFRRASQVHAGVRLLECLGQHSPGGHIPELALVFELVGLPYLGQHGKGLAPHFSGVARVNTQAQLLVGIGAACAELDSPVCELVNHRYTLCDSDRMRVRQYGHAIANANLLRNLAERAE